ncbi:hypothetical protein PN498_12340 [Oscillatoria sp. CS-180]|uniref:hypothetical protein n=1 Tax=Oscillatoria sp. CS-180 TaxID=3021720 RepID=UPI00232CF6FA|nr:hypothetical protein [Oscillatoria sp. CS-180]MDB9526780.1 hypothetical protein [Oscillatoria sp. CS-180]
MQLIISGNPNLGPIFNVVYLANKHYSNQISKVLFIDNISPAREIDGKIIKQGSLFDHEGNPVESERNEIIRTYIKGIAIESIVLDKSGFHKEVPRILSEQLKIYDRSQIVIDLTNGDKFISSTLYASASLSQIENLFFLIVNRNKFESMPEHLSESDYKIEVISPLVNLEKIGKYTFFEIFYYKDKVADLVARLKNIEFESSFLRNQLALQLESCIDSYFLEQYSDSISKIAQIIEEVSLELPNRIKRKAAGDIQVKSPKNFEESINWLKVNFCDPLRGKKNKGLLPYQEQLKELQALDKLIDLIRVHRNLSSHAYDCLRGENEARLVINSSLYILDKINLSEVFSK